jgi:hypothetical protein
MTLAEEVTQYMELAKQTHANRCQADDVTTKGKQLAMALSNMAKKQTKPSAPEVQDVPQLGKLLFHCSVEQWAIMKRLISGRLGFNCSDLALTAILLWARWGTRPPTTVVEEHNWLYIYEIA